MSVFVSAQIIDDGKAISVVDKDDIRSRFHTVWLRDNALDAETRSEVNGQKLITVSQIPENTQVSKVTLMGDMLEITFLPENKIVRYSQAWLVVNCYDHPETRAVQIVLPEFTTWESHFSDSLPTADFSEIKSSPQHLGAWLANIRRYGLAKMTGGDLRSGALLDVAGLFGYVRETNYGRWFEVRSEINPSNLAYTGLGLQAHTDNPYRDPVPTLQILYCLENSVAGGDSSVVDGFRVAEKLKEEAPEEFEILCQYSARFEFRGGDGVVLQTKKPMIELSPEGEIVAIRFNNRSCAPLIDIPYDRMALYYKAYRHFSDIVDTPAMAVSFKLSPGECFIVDNCRVLHARNSFSGSGTRWLQGCYPDMDGLLSTLAVIESEYGNMDNG